MYLLFTFGHRLGSSSGLYTDCVLAFSGCPLFKFLLSLPWSPLWTQFLLLAQSDDLSANLQPPAEAWMLFYKTLNSRWCFHWEKCFISGTYFLSLYAPSLANNAQKYWQNMRAKLILSTVFGAVSWVFMFKALYRITPRRWRGEKDICLIDTTGWYRLWRILLARCGV